jgi:tripartite-type tricarboxylate transporter receptor subunit TctC
MKRCFIGSIIAIGVACVACGGTALGQDYPARAVKIIIGLGPGGGGDVFARTIAEELRKALTVPVVVENRPGGSESIGARACAESPPDGYTVCVLSNEAMVYNQFLFKNIQFDPAKDIQPIAGLFLNTFALAANSSLKVKTVAELVALSRAKPGTLSYGTFSFALVRFMEKLEQENGVDIVRVPFRGGGELVNAMLSGSTPVGLMALSNMISQIEAGRITVIAVNRKERSPLFPDVPTFLEVGRSEEYPSSWFGLFAPIGTAKPIIRKLGTEVARIVSEPEFRQKMFTPRGVEPMDLVYDDFASFISADRRTAEKIVKESGYQPQ